MLIEEVLENLFSVELDLLETIYYEEGVHPKAVAHFEKTLPKLLKEGLVVRDDEGFFILALHTEEAMKVYLREKQGEALRRLRGE